jgi:hypothetical protein
MSIFYYPISFASNDGIWKISSTYISAFGTLLTGISAAVLAYWAIKKYFSARENETKLLIKISNTNYHINNSFQVYIDIFLRNEGIVAFDTCKRFIKNEYGEPEEVEYVWEDMIEKIKYSVELQVKKVKQVPVSYDWSDTNQYETVQAHINLLTDYETPDNTEDPDFFMEPGEIYHLGCWLQLEKGLYEAKVIVVGTESKKRPDYWVRRSPFEV